MPFTFENAQCDLFNGTCIVLYSSFFIINHSVYLKYNIWLNLYMYNYFMKNQLHKIYKIKFTKKIIIRSESDKNKHELHLPQRTKGRQ